MMQGSLAHSVRRRLFLFQRLVELTLVLLLALVTTFVNLIFGWVVFVWRQPKVEGNFVPGPISFSPVIKVSKEV